MFVPGFLSSLYILPSDARPSDRIVFSLGASAALLYPLGFLNLLYEGTEEIFRIHLRSQVLIIVSFCSVLLFLGRKRFEEVRLTPPRGVGWIAALVIVSVALLLFKIQIPDITVDEYEMGYRSYDLYDGPTGLRRALFISTNDHPPLFHYVTHTMMNLLEPRGFEYCSKLALRSGPAAVSLMTIIVFFFLVERIFTFRMAVLSSLLLVVNNGFIWQGRIYLYESVLSFFVTIFVYFLFLALITRRSIWLTISGFFAGCCILTKASGFLTFPLLLLAVHQRFPPREVARAVVFALVLFSPVIIFNIGFYVTMGYTDVFFSRILGTPNPIMGNMQSYHAFGITEKAVSFLYLLADLQSPVLFALVMIGLIMALSTSNLSEPLGWVAVWWLVSTLFFVMLGVRAYYVAPLFPPSMILVGSFFERYKQTSFIQVLMAIVVLYSLTYLILTNYDDEFFILSGDVGRTGHPRPGLNLHRSSAARAWSKVWGFDQLSSRLESIIISKTASRIIVDPDLEWVVDQWYVRRLCIRRAVSCVTGDTSEVITGDIYIGQSQLTSGQFAHVEPLHFRGNVSYNIGYE